MDIMELAMPAKKKEMEGETPELELELESPEGEEESEMSEESPLATFSDDEILEEAKARGLV